MLKVGGYQQTPREGSAADTAKHYEVPPQSMASTDAAAWRRHHRQCQRRRPRRMSSVNHPPMTCRAWPRGSPLESAVCKGERPEGVRVNPPTQNHRSLKTSWRRWFRTVPAGMQKDECRTLSLMFVDKQSMRHDRIDQLTSRPLMVKRHSPTKCG